MHDKTAAESNAPIMAGPPSVAIIGMSGRFPGSPDLDRFWENLVAGHDCISRFTVEELEASGIDAVTLANPSYVRAKGIIDDPLSFDAGLFGFSPNDAEIIDPQQRVFLECAMAALEDAGCNPDNFDGVVGVYAGQSMSTYMFHIMMNPDAKVGPFMMTLGNDKDFLCSRVAYKLNLKGPCVVVASACSTSLVTTTMAFQSLIDYQCDVALSGGVCLNFPHKDGQMGGNGGTYSTDGFVRAFDAQSTGLVGGNGVGCIVMKRLEDAIADRDHIHAVIRSCAVNNDGSQKIGYTAPGVDGQSEAVALSHALGDIHPDSITYVEAHGTGTHLGDPIEVAALTKAFRLKTARTGFCGIGSVKTNIGHLDAAAGVAGLIKTVLAMRHRTLPPSLHFETPNPQIDFDNSPFYVCDKAQPWQSNGHPLRAGVSGFAIGGNNAHVIVEEAPPQAADAEPERPLAVLTLSANTQGALKRASINLAEALRRDPSINLSDAAYTLQVGRKAWKHRLAVVAADPAEAAERLEGAVGHGVYRGQADVNAARIVFLFPGQGAQYVGMTRDLYDKESAFRETLDECADVLERETGADLRTILFAPDGDTEAAHSLEQTRLTQPALFVVENALAKLWMSWGVEPAGMLGHSIGEYVAACLAGVMSLADALRLVSRRGALMQSLPPGAMASIPLPEDELRPLITEGLSLAAVLGPKLCVVAGGEKELDALKQRLAGHGIDSARIRTSHAFHSHEMEPILAAFVEAFQGVTLQPPRIPFISNVTGTWITDAEATDPAYWARQLRSMVRIHDGLVELTRAEGTVCVEVGPGRSLSSLSQQAVEGRRISTVTSCRAATEPGNDAEVLVGAVAKLWAAGGIIDWQVFSGGDERRKVPLPTYPFEREEYSLMPRRAAGADRSDARRSGRVSDLLFAPSWRRSTLPPTDEATTDPSAHWLVFLDPHGLGERCAGRLKELERRVVTVALKTGDEASPGAADYTVAAESPDDFKRIFEDFERIGFDPRRVLHFWNVGESDPALPRAARVRTARRLGFDSLLHLVQAMGVREREADTSCLMTLVSTGLADVTGGEPVEAEKAFLIGPCRVIPVEYPHLGCKSVDVAWQDFTSLPMPAIDGLLAEAERSGPSEVAFRAGARWVRSFSSLYFNPHGDPPPPMPSRLREHGTYLITGGLGGIGLELAGNLARQVGARLVLTGRSAPDSDEVSTAIDRMEAAGGEVMTVQADVADRAAMSTAISAAVARFGPINGVIHAAGVAGRGIMQLKTMADVDRVLTPKVDGLLVLDELLADAPPDFMVVCSSVATVLGGPGQAEYTSANAFLDAFVAEKRQGPTHFLSINWDRWLVVGMAVKEAANQPEEARDAQGLEPAEGIEAFDLALSSGEPQVAVALGPFEWISRYGPPRAPAADTAPAPQRGYRRPDLDTAFEAPSNEVEIAVAGLFHEVLGIKDVGIDDNFFDLGGHSLLGVQLVNRIQQSFAVQIGVGELFNLPTVRSLAAAISERLGSATTLHEGASAPAAARP